MNNIETNVKMIHCKDLCKLVAAELDIEDPKEDDDVQSILAANEIKISDKNELQPSN